MFIKNEATDKALRTFVILHLCQKFELYLDTWDTEGGNSENFSPDDVKGTAVEKRDLDTQTRASYRNNAKKLDRIFQHSKSVTVQKFKRKMQEKHGKNVDFQVIAKEFALAIALVHNGKHGVVASDPDLAAMINPDVVVASLKRWGSLQDDSLLDIVRTFEEVTSGYVGTSKGNTGVTGANPSVSEANAEVSGVSTEAGITGANAGARHQASTNK
jgi:hypothetical protein